MIFSSSWMARTSSLILRWSIRIRATPCGESDSSRSRSCSTNNVGPSGSCSRCLISLITSDLADPLIGSVHKGEELFSVDRAIGSSFQRVISHASHHRDVYWIGKNPATIRISCAFGKCSPAVSNQKLLYSAESFLCAFGSIAAKSADGLDAPPVRRLQPVSVSRSHAIPGAV